MGSATALPDARTMRSVYLENYYPDLSYAHPDIGRYLEARSRENADKLKGLLEESGVTDKRLVVFCIGGTGRRYHQMSEESLRKAGFELYPVQLTEDKYDSTRTREIKIDEKDLEALRTLQPRIALIEDKNTRFGWTMKSAGSKIAEINDGVGIEQVYSTVMIDGVGGATFEGDIYMGTKKRSLRNVGNVLGLRKLMKELMGTSGYEHLTEETLKIFHDGTYPGSEGLAFDPELVKLEVRRPPARLYAIPELSVPAPSPTPDEIEKAA